MVPHTSSPKHSLPSFFFFFNSIFFISIPCSSKGAAKINLFLVHFKTFWILTIKIIPQTQNASILPSPPPPSPSKNSLARCPVTLSYFFVLYFRGGACSLTYIDFGIKVSWSTFQRQGQNQVTEKE